MYTLINYDTDNDLWEVINTKSGEVIAVCDTGEEAEKKEKELQKDKEKVIYRKYKDGDIIALFPRIAIDTIGYLCQSYMHVGQHGGANPLVILSETKPAKPDEYKKLHNELEHKGYNLRVVKRFTREDFEIRKSQYNS